MIRQLVIVFPIIFSNLKVTFQDGGLDDEINLLINNTKRQVNSHKNISDLLDNLLRGYDNSIRPDFGDQSGERNWVLPLLTLPLYVSNLLFKSIAPKQDWIVKVTDLFSENTISKIFDRKFVKTGPPAVIEVDIMVRSMGPISEVDMTYSMDCYFRQSWVDRRLAFQGNKETLALSITMLEKIWKPDTYFYNGKQSYLHTITTPNKFVRLYQDGRVLYSSRLTIKAGCPMNLEDFPMDTQRCPLKFGSFGYTTNDLIYKWNSKRQVAIADDMKLSQFDLIANPSANQTDKVNIAHSQIYAIKEYSMLLVSFHLQRHMGNFLIQVYGPCILLVVLSWVSFWLNREATADRVSLGITTVLTMTFLGLEARTDLPKVPYPTALDFFVFLSFAFIFATIIQFAVVHYFTKYGSGECYFGMELSSDSSSDEEEVSDRRRKKVRSIKTYEFMDFIKVVNIKQENPQSYSVVEFIPLSSYTVPSVAHIQRRKPKPFRLFGCFSFENSKPVPFDRSIDLRLSNASRSSRIDVETETDPRPCPNYQDDIPESSKLKSRQDNSRRLSISSLSGNITNALRNLNSPRCSVQDGKPKRRKKRTPRYNSVSKIDKISRIVFPLLFAAINVFYWYCYLRRSERLNKM